MVEEERIMIIATLKEIGDFEIKTSEIDSNKFYVNYTGDPTYTEEGNIISGFNVFRDTEDAALRDTLSRLQKAYKVVRRDICDYRQEYKWNGEHFIEI
ncbi:hypothetical protein [Clostridium sp.]|uniref:hypothetical protein n=1 Tax=Clostridium sp. TaxID=1506 RepID=UPI001A5665C9|nr:hypothetical protein [Clostridium sp.]MBK5240237.1 hypothetical protein [Clostridium sp.]